MMHILVNICLSLLLTLSLYKKYSGIFRVCVRLCVCLQTMFHSRKAAKNKSVVRLVKGMTSLMLQIRVSLL